jgi:hypothetical protein
MKTSSFVLLFIGSLDICGWAQSPKPFRPATDGIQDDLNPPAEPELTPAELATPPAGQIQKSHLRSVNQLRTILAATLAAVPAGEEGTGSPWYTKAQAYKTD